jgi:hypothetical protein
MDALAFSAAQVPIDGSAEPIGASAAIAFWAARGQFPD